METADATIGQYFALIAAGFAAQAIVTVLAVRLDAWTRGLNPASKA